MIVLCVVYRTMLTPGALFSVCFTEQCLLLELCSHDCSLWSTEQCLLLEICSLCGLQNSAYYWSFVLMIVLCGLQNNAYSWSFVLCVLLGGTVLTPGALFSVWSAEQCLLLEHCSLCALLELCSHDCSLCGLQNNAYSWSFVLCVLYRTVLTPGALLS